MLSQLTLITTKVGEKVFHFMFQPSTIEELKEAAFQTVKFIGQIESDIKKAQEAQSAPTDTQSQVGESQAPNAST